jgi:hypothetical protein
VLTFHSFLSPKASTPTLQRLFIKRTCCEADEFKYGAPNISIQLAFSFSCFFSIIGLVVEFVVAIDEARVRFTDDALSFFFPIRAFILDDEVH